jgi:hypothetical protein
VRDSITTLRDGMTRSWLEPTRADVEQLKRAAEGLSGGTIEERQKAFEARASDIRGRARSIAARSNQLGKSTAAEMRALANAVAVAHGATGFSCYDPALAERLRQAAAQSDQPAELKLREAVFNEGPAGVANAVKNLWRNIGAYSTSLASYVATGGKRGEGRTDTGEPITGRDLIALLATIGVESASWCSPSSTRRGRRRRSGPPAPSDARSTRRSTRPRPAPASIGNGCTGISSTITRRPTW